MITTQAEFDKCVANGKRAYVGSSNLWLSARAGSTVHAWAGSTVNAEAGSTVNAQVGSTVNAQAGSTVNAWSGSTVEAWEGSTVEAWEGSTVNAQAGSTVNAWSGSTVNAWSGSTVEAWQGSTVEAWQGSTVEAGAGSTVKGNGGDVLPWSDIEARSAEQAAFNRKVAEWIVANPDSFNMSQWGHCGTTMCWAGAAVYLAGDEGKALKDRLSFSGAGARLCGPDMMRQFYRTSETDEMRRFAEAIAAGKSVAEADALSRERAPA